MLKYRAAFLDEYKHGEKKGERRNPDDENRTKIRETLEGMAKKVIETAMDDPEAANALIKGAKTLQPHELTTKVLRKGEDDLIMTAQWMSMIANVKKSGSL